MTINTEQIFMLEICQYCILITAFVIQEGSHVRQNQLLSLKLRLQTVLVRGWELWGGEFLWSLRVELRVTMLCVNTPLVTFQTISRNDNLTLKFHSRHTFVQTAIGVILLFESAWCALVS
jgi:hypothetical protein